MKHSVDWITHLKKIIHPPENFEGMDIMGLVIDLDRENKQAFRRKRKGFLF